MEQKTPADRRPIIARADPAKNPFHALAFGLIVTFAVGIIIDGMRAAGVDAGLATLVVLSLATAFLFRIYPEPVRRIGAVRSVALIVAGILAAMLWLAVTGWHVGSYSVDSWIDYPVFLVVQIVVTPIYEEKVVRYVLLSGLSSRLGLVPAAIITSLIFAAVHHGNFVAVFLFSLVASALAAAGYNSVHRSLLHGANNAVLVFWQLAGGFWLASQWRK